jgi:hypothetical protein
VLIWRALAGIAGDPARTVISASPTR